MGHSTMIGLYLSHIGLCVFTAFAYGKMRYHQGCIKGLKMGETICKKYHSPPVGP